MPKGKKCGGRKAGTPNKATGLVRERIGKADPLGWMIALHKTGRVAVMGKNGRPTRTYEILGLAERIRVAEFLARKIVPDAKERTIQFDVGKIENPQTALIAMARVIEALGAGTLSPGEANAVCGVIGNYIKAFEVNEILARIEALEENVA